MAGHTGRFREIFTDAALLKNGSLAQAPEAIASILALAFDHPTVPAMPATAVLVALLLRDLLPSRLELWGSLIASDSDGSSRNWYLEAVLFIE